MDRPAYVKFEVRAKQNREKTVDEGHPVYDDVVFAVITPPGGNLVVEREAEDFIQAKKNANDPFWRHYKESYEAFLEDRDAPIEGTAVSMWPAVSPAELKQIENAGIKAVEDLANANEATIQRLGMGGRALVQRAQAWLETASNQGKVAEKNAALEAEIESLKEQVSSLEEQNKALKADKKKGRKAA